MEKIGFIQRFRISVFDVHSYKKIMKDGLAKAILFLLLITFICDVIPLLANIGTIQSQKDKFIEQVQNNIELMEVKDSQLVSPEDVVKIELNGSLIYINKNITYDELKEGELKDTDTFIGVLKDQIVIESNGISQKAPYTLINDFSFNTDKLIEVINYGLTMGFVTIVVITFISSFIGYLLKGVILASVASITTMFRKKFIRFSELYKCGLYCLALPVIFCAILKLLKLPINWSYFYYIQIIAGGIYAVVAIMNYEDDKDDKSEQLI